MTPLNPGSFPPPRDAPPPPPPPPVASGRMAPSALEPCYRCAAHYEARSRAEAERDEANIELEEVQAERDDLATALAYTEAERDEALAMLVALRRDLEIHIRRADDAQARLGAARLAVNELLHREHRHTGHGRDGHLNEADIAIVTAALGAYADQNREGDANQ